MTNAEFKNLFKGQVRILLVFPLLGTANGAAYALGLMRFPWPVPMIFGGFVGAFAGAICWPVGAVVLRRKSLAASSRVLLFSVVPLSILSGAFGVVFWVPVGAFLVVIIALGFVLPNQRLRPLDEGEVPCPRCAYDLQGNIHSNRCPECGLKYEALWNEYSDSHVVKAMEPLT